MDSDIILTKLSIPVLRTGRVFRGRLIRKAEAMPGKSLLVLSAPAGYGKSTLMAEWATRAPGVVAWVTLGPAENDLVRFWRYVTVALNHAVPTVTRTSLKRVGIMRRPPFETPLHPILAELAAHPQQVTLFLDDFQYILDPVIQDSVATLLRLAPPNFRLVVASRTNPTGLLARLAGSVPVEEIRTRAIAFSRGESSEFFDQALQNPLPAEVKDLLLSRTDGWAAGLQIAAFGLRESADPIEFAHQFSGQHRHLLNFFKEEVLSGILPGMREFVVKTSIMDRFNAELCDAVLQRGGSAAILKDLRASEIFVVPLDDEGTWYRYQSLFRDVARQHLESEYADEAPKLHNRAAAWLEEHGLVEEAVAHFVSAQDWDRVIALVEPIANRLVFSNRLGSLHAWVHELPTDVLCRSPYLCLWLSLAALAADLRIDLERYLAHVEEVAREAGDNALLGAADTMRVLRLGYRGDLQEAVMVARRALATLPPEERRFRGILHRAAGLVEIVQDHPVASQPWFQSSIAYSLESENHYSASVGMALTAYATSRLGLTDQALDQLAGAIDYAARNLDFPVIHIPLVQARILNDGWDIDGAIGVLEPFDELCNETGYMIFSAMGHFELARLYWAKRDTDAMEHHLETARRLALSFGSIHELFSAESAIARTRLADGNWDSVDVWERSERRDPTARSNYQTLSLLERIRLWRAIQAKDGPCAEGNLDRLRELGRQARTDGRGADLVDAWVAQATGAYHLGNVDAALNSLSSALALAESGGLLRPFLEEGPLLTPLLQEAQARGLFPAFLARLEAARSSLTPAGVHLSSSASLSDREVEILRLLAMGYQNHEIADRVVLSENTVKTHLKNVYAKLGIKNRTQAVARGRELRLVP